MSWCLSIWRIVTVRGRFRTAFFEGSSSKRLGSVKPVSGSALTWTFLSKKRLIGGVKLQKPKSAGTRRKSVAVSKRGSFELRELRGAAKVSRYL
jgi:hypothetical protein